MDAAYCKALERAKPLSREEQRELFSRMNDGDVQARNRLVESILRLVYTIAERLECPGCDLDDLIGEGNRLAIRAVEKWEPSRGELSTIASRVILNGLLQFRRLPINRGVCLKWHGGEPAVLFSVLPPHPEESYFDVEDVREHGDPRFCLADVEQVLHHHGTILEKTIFRLRYAHVQGTKQPTYQEISAKVGLSVDECQSVMRQLVAKLNRENTCKTCGDTFVRSQNAKQYCSAKCYRLSQVGKGEIKDCAECGVVFHSQRGAKYCSDDCARRARTRKTRARYAAHRDAPKPVAC